jgi:hypothetical protein
LIDSDVSPWPWPWPVLKDKSQVLGLGLGLDNQVLGLGLDNQVLGLGLGLGSPVLGLGLGLCPVLAYLSLTVDHVFLEGQKRLKSTMNNYVVLMYAFTFSFIRLKVLHLLTYNFKFFVKKCTINSGEPTDRISATDQRNRF